MTDGKGHFVPHLDQSSFGLLDNGRPPEKVFRFMQQTNLPLRVGIMLDTSSSIRQRFQFEQQSAIDFLLKVMHRNDRAFVEGFDVEIDVAQPFTNNVDLLDTGHPQAAARRRHGAVRRALFHVQGPDADVAR